MSKRAEQADVRMRIVIERPVQGVLHSLQAGTDGALGAKASIAGEPLTFDFAMRVGAGPKFFGDQVRREGPVRRFVYIRVGTLAGDAASPWTRRMKIDIHDIDQALINRAAAEDKAIEKVIDGTGKDGSPACATIQPIRRGIATT